jgi:hypothetical protein
MAESSTESQQATWIFDCDIDSQYDEYDGEEVTILDVSRNTLDGDRLFVEFPDGHADWVGTDEVTDVSGKQYADICR